MIQKINLDPNPLDISTTARTVDPKAVTKPAIGNVSPKGMAFDAGRWLRDQLHLSEFDQRTFIHIQTKNKHPHSTKKHK